MSDTLLSIGEVAQATGVSVSAVRYYDERGFVEATMRVGGKRRFASDAVGRINFVRRAQDVGFSLEEINALLDDDDGDWRALVSNKMTELKDRQQRLGEMLDMLTEILECGCSVVSLCPRMPE